MPYSEVDNTTKFKLALIAKKAKDQPKLKFTSLTHLLNTEYLLELKAFTARHGGWPLSGRIAEARSQAGIGKHSANI